jgi:tetratricopeptide (TPR) repeat protein
MRRVLVFWVFVVGICASWQSVMAQSSGWQQNTQLLPQYCKDRVKGINSTEFARWRRTFGDVFPHVHHYCNGIFAEQKARATLLDRQERQRWLTTVVSEMRYVSRHCPTSCVLYPELHTRLGWALQETGQTSQAVAQFQLAIKAKPEYVPAYAKLADAYAEINRPDDARRVLQEGLEAKPGSSMLQRRLRELKASP